MTQNVASVRQVELEQGWTGLVLETDELSLTVLPEKGCDLLALVDRRTGVDVLWKTPWGMPPRGAGTWNAESESSWAECYPGGWQVICPNGGAGASGGSAGGGDGARAPGAGKSVV